ncbi:hypothetical protein [Pseudomonas solani]|uniref:hypothetical protein n=1 Tax=Pseudomonas solani TaxID=2731552 RepID=UPI003D6BDFE4
MSERNLFRYTDLPSLIHILTSRSLTLLDPMTWDDKNDSNFISIYKEKCELASVLALCFTRASETYHHWRVFSPTSSGVRISFSEPELRKSIKKVNGLQLTDVNYIKLPDIRETTPKRQDLPFIKRHPYRPESEVRLLWESKTEEKYSYPLPIELEAITRITLSPWLHPTLADSVKSILKNINGCKKIGIHRTTLINNSEWLKHGTAAN